MADSSEKRKLYRSSEDRILAGVAGGLGEYFEVDATIIRVVFIALTFAGGMGFILYILGWILIPTTGEKATSRENVGQRVEAMADELRSSLKEKNLSPRRNSSTGAWVLIVLGIIFLLNNIGFPAAEFIGRLWPVIFIIIGWWLLQRHES